MDSETTETIQSFGLIFPAEYCYIFDITDTTKRT